MRRDVKQAGIERLRLSAGAYDKVLRVTRSFADRDNSDAIHDNHVAEAIQYRNLDRQVLSWRM